MKLIGNEVKYSEKHLLNKTVEDKHNPVKTVVILIKYFFLIKEYSISQIKKEIKQFMQDAEVELDDKYLDDLIKTNTSSKTTINKLESINITQAEMETIKELGQTEQQRKILFVLLCWYKIKVGVGYADDGTIKVEYTHLNADAHVSMSKAKREEMLGYFYECGLIGLGMGQMAKKIKLYYVNNDSPVIMTITEFDCLDVYYKWYKGGCKGRLKICNNCLDLYISNSNNGKYCEDCAKDIKTQQTIKSNKKRNQ